MGCAEKGGKWETKTCGAMIAYGGSNKGVCDAYGFAVGAQCCEASDTPSAKAKHFPLCPEGKYLDGEAVAKMECKSVNDKGEEGDGYKEVDSADDCTKAAAKDGKKGKWVPLTCGGVQVVADSY